MKRWPAIVTVAATTVILASLGCSRAGDALSAPTLSPIATPRVVRFPGPELSVTDLKYLLIHHFGGVFVAEPVVLPREIRLEQAQNAMPVMRDNHEEFQAILRELGLEEAVTLTDEAEPWKSLQPETWRMAQELYMPGVSRMRGHTPMTFCQRGAPASTGRTKS